MREIPIKINEVEFYVSTGRGADSLCIPLNLDVDESLGDMTLSGIIRRAHQEASSYLRYYNIVDNLDFYYHNECQEKTFYEDARFVINNFNEGCEGYKKSLKFIQLYHGTYVDTPQEAEDKRLRKIKNRWEKLKPVIKATLTERHGQECGTCHMEMANQRLCVIYNGDIYKRGNEIQVDDCIITCRSCLSKAKDKAAR